MGRSEFATKEGNWGGGGGGGGGDFSCIAKSLNFPLLLDSAPTKKPSFCVPLLSTDCIKGQKKQFKKFRRIFIDLRQILPKILPARIFSYIVMTYLKKLDCTKSFNTKQCPAELSLIIIPQVSPRMSPSLMLLCCTDQAWTVPTNLY